MRFASETRATRPRRALRSSTGSASGSARASASTRSFVLARSRAHLSGVMPCALSSSAVRRRRVCFVVVDLLTVRCLPGRDDAFAATALDVTHREEHIADQPGDQLPVLVRLIEVEPINRVRIVEYEPGKLECHAVTALVPLRLPVVPFEFIVAHPILVCRIRSKAQGCERARPRFDARGK